MLKAYNTPGRLLAELWFLWSKKGELWGSARRRNHPFVHFFYSTMIYAIAAFVTYLSLTDWKIPRRETQDQSGYSAASGTEYSESDANSEDQPEANADEVESEPEQAEADADTSSVVADDFKAQGATATSSGPTSEIKSAMESAFETGQPVRWEAGSAKGYAVPSEPEPSTGCRQVHYSEDDRAGWTSPPETICP